MEKDVVEAIETATRTNDKQNKDLCIAVELDDTGGVGDGDEGPVIIRFRTDRYRYRQQQQKLKRVFVLPKRKKTSPLSRHDHCGKNGSENGKRSIYKAVKRSPATATTKKT